MEKRQRLSDPDGSAPDAQDARSFALERVEKIQEGLEDVLDEVSTKILQIEKEANARREPLYESRRAAIANVPAFWVQALMGHPLLVEYIMPRDEEILEYLTQLNVQMEEDIKSGYRITLSFRENPFFSNAELYKELKCARSRVAIPSRPAPCRAKHPLPFAPRAQRYADDGELSTSASMVQWKEGKAPPDAAAAVGSQQQKRSFDTMDEEERTSLFIQTLLSTPDSANPDLHEDDFDEAFCDAIKDDVWTNPVKFFRSWEQGGAAEDDL